MTKVKYPNPEGGDRTSEYYTLSSSGFPDPLNCAPGSKLYFLDTGEEYIQYGDMWELDLRSVKTVESGLSTTL